MARIFNIYFPYGETTYHAMVSVRTTPFFTEYTLNNINDSIQEMLPGNVILSRGPEDFIFPHAGEEHSSDLMRAIIQAVSEHLHVSNT